MVGVAQLVELRVVASVVVGSSPITHPILNRKGCGYLTVVFFLVYSHQQSQSFGIFCPFMHIYRTNTVHSCTFITLII